MSGAGTDRRARRAALISTLALAALITVSTAADPSGLLAFVGWAGGRPVPALWWWAPYLAYVPALLALQYLAARALLASSLASGGGVRLFIQLWGIAILATAVGEYFYSVLVLVPEIISGRFVLPLGETFAFLLWSSGYAATKMLLTGWVPAWAGAAAWPRARAPDNDQEVGWSTTARAHLASLIAGGGMLTIALLGPWLAQHSWQGSPLGYLYRQEVLPFTPTAAAGPWGSVLALGACGLAAWQAAARSLGGLKREASASSAFVVGALAGLAAAGSVAVIQTLLRFVGAAAAASSHDAWLLPATFMQIVEAGSFALVAALPMGALGVLGQRALTVQAARPSSRALSRFMCSGPVLAGSALVLVLLIDFVSSRAPAQAVGEAIGAPAISALPTSARPARGSSDTELQRLSVQRDALGPRIADARGAQITLRGINVNQLNEYYRADPNLADVAALSEQDFADIASLGMNSVRLALSWSRLEPRRGQISDVYLEQIRQAIDWARRHRIHVILDMHQDAWSAGVGAPPQTRCRAGSEPMTGWDGAPAWATLMDDRPPCQITGRDLAPNVSRAFESFYFDRKGIQTSLVCAWAVLARRFASDPTVAGYDLLNEPNFAESPPISSTLMLANYYARCIGAIRAAEATAPGGFAHLVFVEPSILWSGFGVDSLPMRGFTDDRQIVFSPHLYNESITVDQGLGMNLISIERGFALARDAAAQLRAPLWIGEWGFFSDPVAQAALLERQAHAEDDLHVGSAVWVWKQACGDPHVYPGRIAGNTRRRSCPGNEDIATLPAATLQLRRPYARSAPGRIVELSRSGKRLELVGSLPETSRASADAARCDLELWLPGDERPVLGEAAGVSEIEMRRVESGSALLGPSGGWLVRGCVTAPRYRLSVE